MPKGLVIHAANPGAARFDLYRGQKLSDVLAIVPDLAVGHVDAAAERREIARAAAWARRWSPWTRPDGTQGLVLETTGADHLFGGEEAMLAAMVESFSKLGFSTRPAIAPTLGAAHAVARYGGERRCVAPDGLADAVAGFPVASLRLPSATGLLLRRLGLKTVGQLASVPRASLARRFKAVPDRDATWEDLDVPEVVSPLKRLDQMMGAVHEPIGPDAEKPVLRVVERLMEPIGETDSVLMLADRLFGRLLPLLQRQGLGLRRVVLELFRVDGTTARIAVPSSRSTREPRHFLRILAEKLPEVDAGFGFDVAALTARETEAFGEAQAALDHEQGRVNAEDAFASLADRVASRVGEGARLMIRNGSHWPERSEMWLAASTVLVRRPSPPQTVLVQAPTRPERLFDPPEMIDVLYGLPEGPPRRFRWRRRTHDIVRHEGPERIAPEWWREPGRVRARDYYRAEDREGRRYWMFREGFEQDERGDRVAWWLHGLFA